MVYKSRLPVPIATAVRKAGVWIASAIEADSLTRPFVSVVWMRSLWSVLSESAREQFRMRLRTPLLSVQACTGRTGSSPQGIDQTFFFTEARSS